jgi:hypothetical protein
MHRTTANTAWGGGSGAGNLEKEREIGSGDSDKGACLEVVHTIIVRRDGEIICNENRPIEFTMKL